MSQKAPAIIEGAQFERPKESSLNLWLVSIRPYQWVKNVFVLTPLLFGRKLGDVGALVQAALAFSSFCLLSSSIYVFNDVIDAAEDREHPKKRLRPISSGAFPTSYAVSGAVALFLVGEVISGLVSAEFALVSTIYWVLMIGYCLRWKRAIVLDAMIIASGFVLRVVGGAVAVEVPPTHWLIACAFLLALYLAFAKRRQELLSLADAAKHRSVLDTYTLPYLDQVTNILVGAAVVCYALYSVAPETIDHFGTDKLIYGTVFVLYGLLRYLALTQDQANGGDPSKMLLRDKPLCLAVLGWTAYNAVIIYREPIITIWSQLH